MVKYSCLPGPPVAMAKKRASSTSAPSPTTCGDSEPSVPSTTDPRSQPDFEPKHFPLCDGGPAPAHGTTDPIARRKIEFLAAYYRLNRLFARLQASRTGAVPESPAAVLRDIQQAILERDALEDRCEPEGFLGEPVIEEIFYRNIEFTHAQSPRYYRPLASSRFSLSIPIPPAGVHVDGWVRRHLCSAFEVLNDEPPASVSAPPPPVASLPGGAEAGSANEADAATRAARLPPGNSRRPRS